MNDSSNDDDSAAGSQSSQRSGVSLLERIRLQREREARMQRSLSGEAPATTIQVPQYNPNPPSQDNGSNNNSPYFSWDSNGNTLGAGEFFSNAWSNISSTMETGTASLQQMQHDDDLDSSLLLPPSRHGDGDNGNYSMLGYFLTFVKDFNDGFHSLPMAARVVIVVVLLYIAIKLL
jgi:hypothetical protein